MSFRRGRPGAARRLATVAAAVIGLAAAAASVPASADPAPWTPEPIAAPSIPSGVLNAVSCPTSTLCLAVGTVSSPAGTTTSFAQKWDGTTWKRVASSTPAGAVAARLDGVSCVSATNCLAVGSWRSDVTSANTRPFAARWNGVGFVASTVPPAAGFPSSGLRGVSCLTTAVQCVAVGYATKPAGGQPYAVIYRGGNSWQALSAPPPGGGGSPSLDAVSCTSVTRCVAVGGPSVGPIGELVDTWDGSTWTLASTPDTNHLTGVACVGSTFCLAVSGQALEGDDAASLRYDGTTWTAVAIPPDPAGVSRLRAVSCVSAADCTAVGDVLPPPKSTSNFKVSTSLLVHWDGTAWTERTLPQQTPVSNNVLTGVACSAASCTAVGRLGTPATFTYESDANEIGARPLALSGSGTTWQLQDVTGAKSTRTSQYYDISCPTTTFCAAVGQQGGFVDPVGVSAGTDRTEAEAGLLATWNGTTWSTVTIPANIRYLSKVSCPTATACLATGAGSTGAAVVRWNGTTWAAIAGPPGAASGALSCDAPTSCTTLDWNASNSYHWDGATWTPTPAPTANVGGVVDLSCTSAQNCIGVGSNYIYGGVIERHPFVLLRSASGWRQIRAVPAPNSGNTGLSGVSCTAANACTAVGDAAYGVDDATDPPPTSTALVTTWDGHAWTQVASPALGGRTALRDVSCTTVNACTAVGVTGPVGTGDPLIESWNGTAWTQVPASRPAGVFGVAPLNSVSCVAGAQCTAAGSVLVPDGGFRPYVLSGTP